MLFPVVRFIVCRRLDFLQCRNCDCDFCEHPCNHHLAILVNTVFDHALFIRLSVFDKLRLFHPDISSSHKHNHCASDSTIYGPSAPGQSHSDNLPGDSLTLLIRWAHVIFHNIRLYRSRMDPCLKCRWSAAPMIDRIAVLLCLSPMEPNQQRRMLCLCSTKLLLIYARKTSLTSIPCAVLRKLT